MTNDAIVSIKCGSFVTVKQAATREQEPDGDLKRTKTDGEPQENKNTSE